MTTQDRPGEVPPLSSVEGQGGGAPGWLYGGGGPVRAFGRHGLCARCGWAGGLDHGLCIVCQNDPATIREPVSSPAHVEFERVLHQCVLCGADTDRYSEMCRPCERET